MVLLSTTFSPAEQCVSLDVADPLAQFLQPFVKYVPSIWRSKCLKNIMTFWFVILVLISEYFIGYAGFELKPLTNQSLYEQPRWPTTAVLS